MAARLGLGRLRSSGTSPFSSRALQSSSWASAQQEPVGVSCALSLKHAPEGWAGAWPLGPLLGATQRHTSPAGQTGLALDSARDSWVEGWLAGASSLSPHSSINSPPIATAAALPAPVSTGLALVHCKDELSAAALHGKLNELADEVLSCMHLYSLEEVCAWCGVCRQLGFADLANNQAAMTDAVRCFLEGREHEVEPHQLAAVMYILALTETQLPDAAEQEWVSCVLDALPTLSAADLLEVAEAANSLALTARAPHVAARIACTAATSIVSSTPEVAVRLAAAALPSALPHSAPERAALLSSMCQHLAHHSDVYTPELLHKALRLVSGMAAGQPALQAYVWELKQLAMREHMPAAGASCTPCSSLLGCVGSAP